ncbi:MAG: hypothetical protein Q8Q25_01545, partial [bacterium]|nr:hypothetical protein [bacterium]
MCRKTRIFFRLNLFIFVFSNLLVSATPCMADCPKSRGEEVSITNKNDAFFNEIKNAINDEQKRALIDCLREIKSSKQLSQQMPKLSEIITDKTIPQKATWATTLYIGTKMC